MNSIAELASAVREGDVEETVKLVRSLLSQGSDSREILLEGLARGMLEASTAFDHGQLFTLDLLRSSNALKAGVKILKDQNHPDKGGVERRGKVLIGVVEGDIFDVGKEIVGAILTANGFEVVDLGVDVEDESFIEAVRREKPQILALSARLTTTRERQKSIIEALEKAGLRDKVKVIVGGAAVTEEWARMIGADAYGRDAKDALEKVRSLVST